MKLHELQFEDMSTLDKQGREWTLSGTYQADLDRYGEYEDESIIKCLAIPIHENDGKPTFLNDESQMESIFNKSELRKLKTKLGIKLYRELLNP